MPNIQSVFHVISTQLFDHIDKCDIHTPGNNCTLYIAETKSIYDFMALHLMWNIKGAYIPVEM